MDPISNSTALSYKTCSCEEAKKFTCIECFVQICKYCHKKHHNGCQYKWSKEFSLKKEAIFKQLQINFQIFDEQREKTLNEIQPLLEVIRADIPDTITQTVKDKIVYLEKLIAVCKRCRDFNIDQDGIKTLLKTKEIQKQLTQELEELEKRSNSEVFDLIQKFVNSGFQLNTQNSITKTIEPNQFHQIKQNVFNFYIDYSVRCVLKMQISKDIADFKKYFETTKTQQFEDFNKLSKQLKEDVKLNIEKTTLKIDTLVQKEQWRDDEINRLKKKEQVMFKYWRIATLGDDQLQKITGFADYTKMTSINYVVTGGWHGHYSVLSYKSLVIFPIANLNTCDCSCKSSFYTQENDKYVYVVKYACRCGGYFVLRINLSYFD